jgi:hypothetical protein
MTLSCYLVKFQDTITKFQTNYNFRNFEFPNAR